MLNIISRSHPPKTYVTYCLFSLSYDYSVVGDGTNRR